MINKNSTFYERLSALYDAKYNIKNFTDTTTNPGWYNRAARDMFDNKILLYSDMRENAEGMEARKKEVYKIGTTLRGHINGTKKEPRKESAADLSGKWLDIYRKFFGCSAAYLFGEINGFTPEMSSIQELTGLSNRATKQLLYLYKNADKMPVASEMLDTLNLILSNASRMSDLLQAVGSIAGTVHYNDSADNLPPLPDMNTADPAFIKVVQEKRLVMAVEHLK